MRVAVRGGAVHSKVWTQPAESGISVWNAPLCVPAGMQRGSSPRSHHIGGRRGSSLAAAAVDSMQLSMESVRSQRQSAASAEDATSSSIKAVASAERGFLIEANPKKQSTARESYRKKCLVGGRLGG